MADFFECECMVRGYHKYNDVWEAEVGTTLQCQRETGNPHDIYAVAVLKSGVIVGHVPKKNIDHLLVVSPTWRSDSLYSYWCKMLLC